MSKSESLMVRWSQIGPVFLIELANAPVNVLSAALRKQLLAALESAAINETVSAVVLTGNESYFSAGADIREFSEEESEPTMDSILSTVENLRKPVIAALSGTALGGGLELALSCHYRVVAGHVSVGLPEVHLGLIPGLGGTQRLPRLVGLQAALDIIVSGRRLPAAEIDALGLAVRIANGSFTELAISFAERRAEELESARQLPPRVRDLPVRLDAGLDPLAVLRSARIDIGRKYKGLEAPLCGVDAIQATLEGSFDDGLLRERALFMRCLASPQSAALVHLFHAERTARRITGVAADQTSAVINHVGVVGAGTMGRGISIALLLAGLRVTLVEPSSAALNQAEQYIHEQLDKAVKRNRLNAESRGAIGSNLRAVPNLRALHEADLVIEAVYEDLALKQQIFRALDAVTRSDTLLATNTSGLDVELIAQVTRRPELVLGLHFFSPAQHMRLVEVIRTRHVNALALRTAAALVQRMQKVPVFARVCDGFIGNRIFDAYWRCAEFMVEEGASPAQVDRALEEFGMAMGPFAVSDLAGLDIGHAIRTRQHTQLPPGVRSPMVEETLFQAGRLGQKSGGGWYRYEAGSSVRQHDEAVDKLIADYRQRFAIQKRPITDAQIVEQCVAALINEAAKVLEEGIAERASDIDVVAILGYGFPAYRGGPMYYSANIGLQSIVSLVREHAEGPQKHWWSPATALTRAAARQAAGAANPWA